MAHLDPLIALINAPRPPHRQPPSTLDTIDARIGSRDTQRPADVGSKAESRSVEGEESCFAAGRSAARVVGRVGVDCSAKDRVGALRMEVG
jgi:hypothetical protein